MSWPIGYGKPGRHYSSGTDGTVHVDGVPVSESDGWIVLRRPASRNPATAAGEASVRVRLSVDRTGRPFLYAEEVEDGDVRYEGVHAWIRAAGAAWLASLTACIEEAIDGQLAEHARAAAFAVRPATTRRAAVVAVRSPSADETWRGQKALPLDADEPPASAAAPPDPSPSARPPRRRRSTGGESAP